MKITQFFQSRMNIALTLMSSVLIIGVLGYRFLSELSWIDALYMTIITVTTVGFSEVGPMDTQEKLFTVVLIILSIFIFAFAISVITEYILSRNSLEELKNKKVKNKIENLTDHVIVCGFGRNGMQAVKRLTAYNKSFVIIERDKEVIEKYDEDVLFVEGDANEDEVLQAAGINRARYLITALPDDATNLFVVLSARQLNKALFVGSVLINGFNTIAAIS